MPIAATRILTVLKWILVLTLLISTFCFADTEDYVHADFYRGLAGLKQQVEEINRDLLLLENATLSSAEFNRRLARIEQDVDTVKTLYNQASTMQPTTFSASELSQIKQSLDILDMQEIRSRLQSGITQQHQTVKSETLLASRDFTNQATRNLATSVLTLTAILVAVISAVIAWMNHVQSNRTKEVKDKAKSDLEMLKGATDQDLVELQSVTQRLISGLAERHQSDIDRLQDGHQQKIERLEQINLEKVKDAENAFDKLMSETETQNGLVFKNLAISIYLRRFLIEDGYDRFFDDLSVTSIEDNTTARYDPSVLREVIAIQEHAISRFERVKDKLDDARMLYFEALLDLAFYEAEMTRFGVLNDKALERINESLMSFEENLGFWLTEERNEYQDPERLPRFIFRVICMVDSLIFIRVCLLEKTVFTKEVAKCAIFSQVTELLAEKAMATKEAVDDVLSSKQCDSLWQKYTEFKAERPRLFER